MRYDLGMEIAFVLTAIVQSMAVSLGVGGSTLAIINFFAAIADGKIDETERRMMGVVYVVLRIAMVAILITSLLLGAFAYAEVGAAVFTTYVGALWTLVAILYINALLMTLHIVPSTIGPALQASTWYSLGAVLALAAQDITNYTYWQFLLSYICAFVLAVAIVNGMMAYLKSKKNPLERRQ